jgi:hypothetical protein
LTARAVATPVPRPDTPVEIGSPVALVKVALVGVPRIGVTKVGDVANTAEPDPVSSVKAPARLEELNEPKDVALPTEVIAPVKFALVVTLPAVKPEAVPVMFVPTKADGVPKAGVTSVGDVANTAEPVPVSSVNAPSNSAEVNDPKDVALPTEVTAPVKLALVVTLPAVKPEAVPVIFVPTSAEGVPNAGVTKVGLVANTKAPLPVSSVTAEIRLADDGVAKKVATPAPRPDTPVLIGRPVALVKVPLVGVPRIGVTRVGDVANTNAPDPVSSVIAEAKFALDGVAKRVATPAPNPLTPVEIGKPVALVSVADVGVPNTGVTSVGLVDNTLFPEPVLVPTPVPPFVTFNSGPASNNASIKSRSALTLPPHVSVLAPTSGLVSNRFVVVVSAIFSP